MRIHLRDLLETRLRLIECWKRWSEVPTTTRIRAPIFIVGMPRSGSTFLHELFSEDPNNRAPRVWEIMFPVAQPGQSQDRRVRKAEVCLWWFRRLAPEADSVYPMRASTPHECVAIHSYTFLSEEFISTCRIPSYEKFLHSTDLSPAYTWQKRFLQHLQLHQPDQRWVLKSPDHVYGLAELFRTFPDASIIQTHRNPEAVLRSSAELTRVLHRLYARPEDFEQLLAREARVLAKGAERFIRFRDQHPELADRFIDVKYSEFVADPLTTLSRIYQQLAIPLGRETARRMQLLAASRSRYRGRAGAHSTDLRVKRVVRTGCFERYCSRFGLSREPGI